MKRTIFSLLVALSLLSMASQKLLAQGHFEGDGHNHGNAHFEGDGHDHGKAHFEGDGHDHGKENRPKHNQMAAEFPGHKFAMEIAVKDVKVIVDRKERAIPTVFAYLTDSHFKPIHADVKEVRLNFVIDKKPKSFVLLPVKVDPKTAKDVKRPLVFELKDPMLVKLISSGWKGDASVSMRVGKTPFNAKLVKAKDIKTHNH